MTAYKHGLSKTRIHAIWRKMLVRCFCETSKDYPQWGGRGITVCNQWTGENGFQQFYEWAMKSGYSDSLTIERIDCNGNYTPYNCKWASKAEQNRNRRNVVKLTYNGITMSCAEWSAKLGLSPGTVNNRLHKGYSVEECLFGRKATAHKVPKKYRQPEKNGGIK